MLGRLFCLLALPALGSAGIIVQTGGALEDWSTYINPFPFEPHRLNAVEASFAASASWSVLYEFAGTEGVPLNPPAKITTRGYGGGYLNLPGGGGFFTPEIVCEFEIPETTSGGVVYCDGHAHSQDTWVGDPKDPLWFDSPIYAGDASGGADASCAPGLPAITCEVTPRRVYASISYELRYYYDEDFPTDPVPEPGSAALVCFSLIAGAIAVRRRG